MNFKLLFPTFRNRYRFVKKQVKELSATHVFDRALNLGAGEGDYDRMLAGYVRELIACDINEEDVAHARALNKQVMNLRYETNDALTLSYPNGNFDLVVSCEVIEHVGRPDQMLREMHRVLAPGAYAVMTFPSREFPFTYDPVNRIWQSFRKPEDSERLIAQGAYAFGHEYLIGRDDFFLWAEQAGFEVVRFEALSGALVGLLEMYWTGIAQSIFKKNARNATSDTDGGLKIRPQSDKDPLLGFVTDAVLWLDRFLFNWSERSVGKGVVLRKKW